MTRRDTTQEAMSRDVGAATSLSRYVWRKDTVGDARSVSDWPVLGLILAIQKQ